jgi:hypothetical protein
MVYFTVTLINYDLYFKAMLFSVIHLTLTPPGAVRMGSLVPHDKLHSVLNALNSDQSITKVTKG